VRDLGTVPDLKDSVNGETATFYAVRAGKMKAVETLGKLGADFTVLNNKGEDLITVAGHSK
jgi:ankyrin repeat protein